MARHFLKPAIVIFQIVSVISGFYAAWLWWEASQAPSVVHGKPADSADGDLLLVTGKDGQGVFYNFAEQAKMNRGAARWTAIAVGGQAIVVVLGLL